ncbi:hypothetical protein EXIGLDRAFT_729633 [Exidia glandulosa HHB12029]|uniref:Uncharacterized protein n=1 Tax=Exidia glandulosa HHB12029 TaxID=1314781 RepID=A0A165LH58_EXIGL|nr:hypothetical protein EXIGLDRAFT_729633 [Exidia glandulosa HHB12029]
MIPGRHFILKGGFPLISGEPGQPLAVIVVEGPGNVEAWEIIPANTEGEIKLWFAKSLSEKGVYLGKATDDDQLIGVADKSEALAFQAIPVTTGNEDTYIIIANELVMTNVPPIDGRLGLAGYAWLKFLKESDAEQAWSIPLAVLEGKETHYGA